MNNTFKQPIFSTQGVCRRTRGRTRNKKNSPGTTSVIVWLQCDLFVACSDGIS